MGVEQAGNEKMGMEETKDIETPPFDNRKNPDDPGSLPQVLEVPPKKPDDLTAKEMPLDPDENIKDEKKNPEQLRQSL